MGGTEEIVGGVWRKVEKGLNLVKLKSNVSLLIKQNLCSITLRDIIKTVRKMKNE